MYNLYVLHVQVGMPSSWISFKYCTLKTLLFQNFKFNKFIVIYKEIAHVNNKKIVKHSKISVACIIVYPNLCNKISFSIGCSISTYMSGPNGVHLWRILLEDNGTGEVTVIAQGL